MKRRIATISELPTEGRAKEFFCEGKPVCVARVNGALTAMDNVCPHRGGPLSDGVVLEGLLVCPWHGWQFDPMTGKSVQVANTGVELYRITIEGEEVFLEK